MIENKPSHLGENCLMCGTQNKGEPTATYVCDNCIKKIKWWWKND